MSEELKPCPFCGSDQISYKEREGIECCSCGCLLPWEELTDENGSAVPNDYIIEKWNNRSENVTQRTAHVDGAGFGRFGHCHECGRVILSAKFKFCPGCGLPLDWDDDME